MKRVILYGMGCMVASFIHSGEMDKKTMIALSRGVSTPSMIYNEMMNNLRCTDIWVDLVCLHVDSELLRSAKYVVNPSKETVQSWCTEMLKIYAHQQSELAVSVGVGLAHFRGASKQKQQINSELSDAFRFLKKIIHQKYQYDRAIRIVRDAQVRLDNPSQEVHKPRVTIKRSLSWPGE